MAACPSTSLLQATKMSPRSLEDVAMTAYLSNLEDACAVYIQLSKQRSRTIAPVLSNAMAAVKAHLSSHLFGTASTVLRQEMIDRVMSGVFPSKKYRNGYEMVEDAGIFGTDNDTKALEDIRQNGVKCNSLCCTGSYIIETMFAVLVNEDVRELKFDLVRGPPDSSRKLQLMEKERILGKYVSFQVPMILAHYVHTLQNLITEEKTAKLERLVIQRTDIPSQEFALKNHYMDFLCSYSETEAYFTVPGAICQTASSRQELFAYQEHVMGVVQEMFMFRDSLPRLTEIVLGREACNTGIEVRTSGGKNGAMELFRGIGSSCPNLKVLDVSNVISLSSECLLQLFFHDLYHTLHQFVYLPEQYRTFDDGYAQDPDCTPDKIHPHDLAGYCPWCLDDWCANWIKAGCEYSDMTVTCVDDRLYDSIVERHGGLAKRYLINVIKASDLVKSIHSPSYCLRRPQGHPSPWDSDFVDRPGNAVKDCGNPWFEPEEGEVKYVAMEPPDVWAPINPIVNSLQCLKLNTDAICPKYDIVPFLLAVLPNVKSLGHINVLRGLKMIRDIPGLNGIGASNIEEIDIGFGNDQLQSRTNSGWADRDILDLVDDFGRLLTGGSLAEATAEVKKKLLSQDIRLVAQECPNLKNIQLYLFGDDPYLEDTDTDVWAPFAGLLKLRQLHLIAHQWSEAVALFKTVGERLDTLYLSLDGRGAVWDNNVENPDNHQHMIPKFEEIMARCPNVQKLTLSFGIKATQVHADSVQDTLKFNLLRELYVHTYMTKRAFSYIWARTPNLRRIKVSSLVMNDEFPHDSRVEFDEDELIRLLRANPMKHLEKMDANITLKDIPTAKVLIEALSPAPSPTGKAKRPPVEVRTLNIRVGLPHEDYPDQENMLVDLAQIMQAMRTFKMYCKEKERTGLLVTWRWDRFGFLESFAEVNELNALIEPNG